jgi:hypothetical protein
VFLDALQTGRVRLPRWVAAGVLCLGVTTTNLMQPVIARAVVAWRERGWSSLRSTVRELIVFLVPVGLITGFLASVQKLLYPSSRVFFTARAFTRELPYASLAILDAPLVVAPRVLEQLLLVNVVGPLPTLYTIERRPIPAVMLSAQAGFSTLGLLATLLWAGGVAFALTRLRRLDRPRAMFVAGLVLCFLFNLALHSVYGVGEKDRIELLLYSTHFTFLPIGLACVALSTRRWLARIVAALLVALTGANNVLLMTTLLGIYSG